MGWAGGAGLFGPDMHIGTMYLDDPDEVAENDLRSELCVSAPEDFEAPEGQTTGRFPDGRFVAYTYVGPYKGLNDARRQGFAEVQEQHTLRHAPCFDLFIDDPGSTPPEKLRTEIWIPIE